MWFLLGLPIMVSCSPVVQVAEERTHQRLDLHGASFELADPLGEPGAPRARRQNPDYVLCQYAVSVFASLPKLPYPEPLPGDTFLSFAQLFPKPPVPFGYLPNPFSLLEKPPH
jgi:hypothetical protein